MKSNRFVPLLATRGHPSLQTWLLLAEGPELERQGRWV